MRQDVTNAKTGAMNVRRQQCVQQMQTAMDAQQSGVLNLCLVGAVCG
jgi:hypothetical protein